MNLLFLHGALGSKAQWQNITQLLPQNIAIHSINFPQHGENTDSLNELTIESLANYVDTYIQKNGLENCVLIGYSLGGYVALWLAAKQPKYLQKVITLATKFTWKNDIIAQENTKLTIENLQPIIEKLKTEHSKNFDNLITNTHQIISSIAQYNLNKTVLANIVVPVVLLIGENDKMVSLQETNEYGSFIQNNKVMVLPLQPHIIQKMDTTLLRNQILNLIA